MVIETKRLKIIVLTQEQLEMLVDNIPNENREVEIGYGLGKKHEHFGYMTEAVEAFCTWGKKQASVKHIIAETEIDNFSSQRVLQRNGFIEYFRDKTIWWKL